MTISLFGYILLLGYIKGGKEMKKDVIRMIAEQNGVTEEFVLDEMKKAMKTVTVPLPEGVRDDPRKFIEYMAKMIRKKFPEA